MALTDERIKAARFFAAEKTNESKPLGLHAWNELRDSYFARAIESAATAPLLERIAELEQELACERVISFRNQVAELEQQLSEARKQMEAQKDEWLSWEAKRKALEQDADRWAHACKGNNKQINVCSWDGDAYEFVGYAMKKEAIDAIADEEIAAMKKGKT